MKDEYESRSLIPKSVKIIGGLFVFVIVALILGFQAVSWNEADERIVHQGVLSGVLTVIEDPGPYLKAFGTTTEYKKVISVNFSGDTTARASAVINPIGIRFLDTTTGNARGVARLALPGGKQLIKIHTEFGSQATLISNLLVRATTENVKASARMMSVEQHYSGGNGQLSQDFFDQLSNGIFVTKQITQVKQVAGKEKDLSQSQRVTIEFILNDDKTKRRNAAMLAKYGIVVADASIIDVDYEEKVDNRLEAQKQAAADEALSRQNLKKAEQAALTEVAKGAQAIAKQRAESEKLKVKEQIDAERVKNNAKIAGEQKVLEAELSKEEQVQILSREKLEAQGLRVMASARQQAKSSAIDPKYVFDQTLKAQVAVQMSLYENLGKSAGKLVPAVQFGPSVNGANSASALLQMMGANAALELKTKVEQGLIN